jgi:hypothetical protein
LCGRVAVKVAADVEHGCKFSCKKGEGEKVQAVGQVRLDQRLNLWMYSKVAGKFTADVKLCWCNLSCRKGKGEKVQAVAQV